MEGMHKITWWWVLVILVSFQQIQGANASVTQSKFDLEYAETIAYFNRVTYCTDANDILNWTCLVCNGTIKHFDIDTVVHVYENNLLAYSGYYPKFESIIIAFRGTQGESLDNWITDLSFFELDLDLPYPEANGAKVHGGFLRAYNYTDMRPLLLDSLKRIKKKHGEDKKVIVTGHSLGGALATFCALDTKMQWPDSPLQLFTFGSPRIGNEQFYEFFHTWIGDAIRLVHGKDIVPSLPPRWVGYHHLAREVWSHEGKDSNAPLINVVCDDSGEDPNCSNSVCTFGFCTSVSDHLTYLNIPLQCDNTDVGPSQK